MSEKSIEVAGFSINPNLFRSTGPETVTETPNGEFKYEFFYEVPPTKEVYRAFFLNIQFLGMWPKCGQKWPKLNLTQIQFRA